MGLGEDALKGMPTDQREAIEKQIAEEIKKQLAGIDDKGTSQTDDVSAETSAPTAAGDGAFCVVYCPVLRPLLDKIHAGATFVFG